MTRYGVNLADITRPELGIANGAMLAPIITTETHDVPGQIADVVAVLATDDKERILAIRDVFALRGYLVRMYEEGSRGGWKRLPKSAAKRAREIEAEIAKIGGHDA